MEIVKRTIRGSPYIGVFSLVTEDIGLFPISAERKNLKGLEETLGIEILKASVSNSSLLGVMCLALGKRIAVPESVEKNEVSVLEDSGLKVLKVEELTALGNIFALNKRGGVASNWVPKKNIKQLERFFRVKFHQKVIKTMDLPGALITVTNKGFIVNPNISEGEFKMLRKTVGVYGAAATANYGDAFVGNSVVANSKAAIVGMLTTGYELMRIDEGLRGD